ncbi:hypothetical protein RJD24_18925 [Bacillaceae bacterium IKA-2]|nr:hypothetical protein RJD24_18925 [Bacillaceae bacterium IKA-2]
MKKPESEFLKDGTIKGVDEFPKEFDGINKEVQKGIQEVWESGLIEEDINEQRVEDV